MDFSWWTPAHTNEILNSVLIVLLAWGIYKILAALKRVEEIISRITKAAQ